MKVALLAPAMCVPNAFNRPSEYLFELSGANTGNFAFTYALHQHLAPNVKLFYWHAKPEAVRERCQIVVLACANQLGAHTDMGVLSQKLEAIGLPVVAIGLGAQAVDSMSQVQLPEGTLRWVKVLAGLAPSKGPNIGVRGDFTLRVMEKLGLGDRAAVIGCQSNFTSEDPNLGHHIAAKYFTAPIERVAVAAGLRHQPQLAKHEQALAKLLTSTGGIYVTQSDINMIRIARSEFDRIEPDELEKIRAYVFPELETDAFKRWCRRHAACFVDSPSWMEAMRAFDFAVGPRFHGVMQALQAGTPGGVIAHDSRTRELCETMLIPFKVYSELEPKFEAQNLYDIFPFDGKAYQERRRGLLLRYIGILSWAGIKPSDALIELEAKTKPLANGQPASATNGGHANSRR